MDKQNRQKSQTRDSSYWKNSLIILSVVLSLWFIVSLLCGILCRDWLDANFPNIGNAPFGFWMAQQGSIIGFVVLLIVYFFLMNKLDAQYAKRREEKE